MESNWFSVIRHRWAGESQEQSPSFFGADGQKPCGPRPTRYAVRAANLRHPRKFLDADLGRFTGFFLDPCSSAFIRVQFLVAILLVVGFGLLIFWLLSPVDDGTLAAIQQRGALHVGLDASFPPFETVNAEGRIEGLDVDIAQAIATDLGVELEIVNIGFDGLYDALLARRVDLVISGLPYDPRWTKDVAYTRNYFNAGQVLATRHDERAVQQVEDLSSHTLAIEWGSQADMEARRLEQTVPNLSLDRHATAAEAIDALLAGEADAVIVDAVSGVGALPRGLRLVTYLTDEWYAAAVHLESQELLESVNDSLMRLEESGEMAKMVAKWLHGN